MKNKIVSIGAVMGFISVGLGAFGTHALQGKIGYDLFDIFKTASYYLTVHSLAIILYGIWMKVSAKEETKCWPAALFFFGTVVFSGSLYTITFTGIRTFGAITPIGGIMLLAGWLGFAFQAAKKTNEGA